MGKRQVQNNKQVLSSLKRKYIGGCEEYRIAENGTMSINPQFTRDECQFAIQGFRKFGKNYKIIAEVMGTKSDAHLRNFYLDYRRKYNLDSVLKEYEAVNGPITDTDDVIIEDGDGKIDQTNGKESKTTASG